MEITEQLCKSLWINVSAKCCKCTVSVQISHHSFRSIKFTTDLKRNFIDIEHRMSMRHIYLSDAIYFKIRFYVGFQFLRSLFGFW